MSSTLQNFAAHRGISLGPFLIGFFLDAVFMGVLLEMFLRWRTYAMVNEDWKIKSLVIYMMIVSIGITGYLVAWMMHLFVYNYANYQGFDKGSWAAWNLFIDVISRTPVTAFFVIRAWRMCKKNIVLLATCVLLLLASTLGAIAALAVSVDTGSKGISLLGTWLYLWLGGAMAVDVVTTCAIIYSLSTSRTGWQSTDRLIQRLIVIVAETQLPPTIAAIFFLVVYAVNPASKLPTLNICAPKIYFLCLLTVLNTRYSLRLELTKENNTKWRETANVRSRSRGNGTINVTTETYTHTEQASYGIDFTSPPKILRKQTPHLDPFNEPIMESAEDLTQTSPVALDIMLGSK